MFPPYRNQSADLQSKTNSNQLAGFYMMGNIGRWRVKGNFWIKRFRKVSYSISSNKPRPPRRLFNFEALGCGAYWRAVLKRGAYFNARGMIWKKKKIENFVIFSFQTTINNFHYDI